MADSEADDGVWSVVTRIPTPAEAIIIEYGAQRLGDQWIWAGPNGTVEVLPEDAGTTVAAEGLIIPEHGTWDLALELDVNAIAGAFDDLSIVKVKGTFNSWALAEMTDEDADGVWEWSLGESVGPYDGLLACGDSAEFVFTFGAGDVEYKVDAMPPTDGVAAFLADGEGEFAEVDIVRAENDNTAVQVEACE